MTATAYVRDHLAQVDTSEFTATLVPVMFCDVDYTALNGIECQGDIDEADWDFARYAEDATST